MASGTSVAVQATSEAKIEALTIAGALTAKVSTGDGFGLDGAGAGAGGNNQVTDTVTAYVTGSTSRSGPGVRSIQGDVTVAALDDSTIDVQSYAIAITASGSVGDTTIAISPGGSVAINSIANTVDAHIDSSTVDAEGGLTVSSQETSTISALTVGAAVALTLSGSDEESAIGLSGIGAITSNTIANKVQAYIENSQAQSDAIRTETGGITVEATDTATTDATSTGVSASVSAAFGGSFSASFGVGVVFADNTISDQVQAYLLDANVHAGNDLTVQANSTNSMDAHTTGVAAALAITLSETPISLAGAGVGTRATNTIANAPNNGPLAETLAYITGGTVMADQGISVRAKDNSNIARAENLAVAASAGLFAVGVSITTATNTVANTVGAYITNAEVTSLEAGVDVSAQSTSDIQQTHSLAAAASALVGGAGTGATDTASVDGATEAYLGSQGVVTANKGTVTVESMSSSTAIVNTSCGSGALVAGDTSDATAEIGRNTLADVGQARRSRRRA